MAIEGSTTLAEQLAEDAAGRFLHYVRIDTQSAEDSEAYPSSEGQLVLLRLLRDELEAAGLADARLDEHGYVVATLPSTVAHEVPTIALFAHVDTAREVSGSSVDPQRRRYEGGAIPLGDSGSTIRPEESPELANHVGHELITTDGTTLLGADDKAGVAEIVAAVAYLAARPEIPHGPVKVAFNPDEEIGRGVIHFPVQSLGAAAAYTVDGSTAGELQAETFSAAHVRIRIRGRAIHPGWAKGERGCRRTASPPRRRRGVRAMSTPSSHMATRRRRSSASSSAISTTSASPSTSRSCAGSPRRSPRPSHAARSRSRTGSSTATRAPLSSDTRRSWRTSRRRFAAPVSRRSKPPFAAAPTARP
jgi:hypothetical protein